MSWQQSKTENYLIDSLTSLKPGTTIEVTREFRDVDGVLWPVGRQLSGFKQYSCVPYHGGYTISFENAVLRLCDLEPDNCEVLFKSAQFFRLIAAVD